MGILKTDLTQKPRHNIVDRLTAAVLIGMILILMPVGLAVAQPAGPAADQSSPPGGASTQIDSLEAEATAINKELSDLNRTLEIVVEQHNATQVEFDRLTLVLADSRARLDAMLAEQNSQEKLLTDRLKALYKAGDVNFLSILLNSNSLSDFYEQARYIAKISEQDAKLESQFKARADEIAFLTDEIDDQRSRQRHLGEELVRQQTEIETRIEDRQARLDQVDAEVKKILEQEAERQRAEQARIAAEYQAMLKDLQISDGIQAQVVQTAMQYLGVPYVWGGESPSGFDCSGLTKYVFAQHGVSLPHYAASQFDMGAPVQADQLQPGDLVFWGPGHPYHVGMYVGNGKYIEAPTFGEVVKISTLVIDGEYAGARRYPLKAKQ